MKEPRSAPIYSPLWKKLYSLIHEFVKTKPWELFENEDVFYVQSPHGPQLYLCSVMGNAGEEFGLSAFRGDQGIRNYYSMITREEYETPRNLIYELDMLSFTLGARDFMEKKDLQITKKLLLSFQGGNWPLIRSYRPHYAPWFLTESEIEVLCDCIEQTLALYDEGEDVLEQIRNNENGDMLLRSFQNSSWVSTRRPVLYPAKEEAPAIHLDDFTAQRLRNLPDNGLKEEIDLVHLPGIITDHEPFYFGLLLVGINEQKVNQYSLVKPFEDYFEQACKILAQSFLKRGSKPCMVLLNAKSLFSKVFERIAAQADIRCEMADELPYITDFENSMLDKLNGNEFDLR